MEPKLIPNHEIAIPRFRVILIDDHAYYRDGMVAALDAEPDFHVVAQFSRTNVVPTPYRSSRNTDVIILDLSLNDGVEPMDNLRTVVAWGPKVVVHTQFDNEVIRDECRQIGASGFLGKGSFAHCLPEVARKALAGKFVDVGVTELEIGEPLNRSERDVLALLPRVSKTNQMAAMLHLAPGTINNIVRELKSKTGCESKLELASWAQRNGFGIIGRLPDRQ